MAGYQRFVAYVYEYLKGKKGNNCGFIKVEVREQRCRLELHLQCSGLPAQAECKIYGFVRNGGLMDGNLLGTCKTGEEMAQCLIETDAMDMNGTGVPLGKMGGLILITESGAFFGTEWDDIPIRPENFREVKSISRETTATRPGGKKHEERQIEVGNAGKEEQMKKGEGIQQEEMGQEESGKKAEQDTENSRKEEKMQMDEELPEEKQMQEAEENKKDVVEKKEEAGENKKDVVEKKEEAEENKKDVVEKKEETEEEPNVYMQENTPVEDCGQSEEKRGSELRSQSLHDSEAPMNLNISFQSEGNKNQYESGEMEMGDAAEQGEDSGMIDVEEKRSNGLEQGRKYDGNRPKPGPPQGNRPKPGPPQGNHPKPGPPQGNRPKPGPPQGNHPKPQPPQGNRPRPEPPRRPSQGKPGEVFQPFGDEEITDCRKIHIRDLARLNRRDIALRNNRFLQYGYYNFGHLLICRRADGRYILGVPGGYDQQERFMANMFGFPYFKESRYIQLPKGKGGYWYRLINTPDFY